jgi:dual-specificity kinase
MQTAVHQLPQPVLSQYPRRSLNAIGTLLHPIPPGPPVMPTPPVSTRKRKRAHQYTVSYSEVQELDSDGKLREVIVIEDTPPPPTISPATTYHNGCSVAYQPPVYSAPIRTRARAAAEAQALSASTSLAALVVPTTKKRKKDFGDEPCSAATKKKDLQPSYILPTSKSCPSSSAAATEDVCVALPSMIIPVADSLLQASKGPVPCDDKEGHYIIVPDDVIHNHCAFPTSARSASG